MYHSHITVLSRNVSDAHLPVRRSFYREFIGSPDLWLYAMSTCAAFGGCVASRCSTINLFKHIQVLDPIGMWFDVLTMTLIVVKSSLPLRRSMYDDDLFDSQLRCGKLPPQNAHRVTATVQGCSSLS